MILLRALAALSEVVTVLRLVTAACDSRTRTKLAEGLPTTGCAWSGPWPRGALPVCVTYGDGDPIFIGYLSAPDPDTRPADIAAFWRGIADDFERDTTTP